MIAIEIYRIRIGLNYSRQAKIRGIKLLNYFELLIIMSLLLIAGVERNPYPSSESSVSSNSSQLIVLGFNDTSALVGHFVSSPRERGKIDRRDNRGDKRKGQGRKRNRNEREETQEIKISPSTLTCYKDSRPCPTVSQYQLDALMT